jgi:hypothetical protein
MWHAASDLHSYAKELCLKCLLERESAVLRSCRLRSAQAQLGIPAVASIDGEASSNASAGQNRSFDEVDPDRGQAITAMVLKQEASRSLS